MAKKTKVVLNRPAVKDQILNGSGMHGLMQDVAASMAGPGVDVEVEQSNDSQGGGRVRARAYGKDPAAVSRALGRARA